MKYLNLALIVVAAAGSLFSTSCATTKGFGQDLQKLGNTLENEANESGGAAPVHSSPTTTYTAPPSSNTPAAY